LALPSVERNAGKGVERAFQVEAALVQIIEGLRDEGVEQRGGITTLRRCRLP